jgi:hypothetical protein
MNAKLKGWLLDGGTWKGIVFLATAWGVKQYPDILPDHRGNVLAMGLMLAGLIELIWKKAKA